ncbi:SBBP repeat-containing protein [Mariniphaga sediminis]|uniref:SBBP repeat-containing protein n=1 Tax=Mariniphaga sediminis TaxID=1628158 RepID=UPI00356A8EBD
MADSINPTKKTRVPFSLFSAVTIFCYLIVFLPIVSQSQPNWAWATSAGGSSSDYGQGICSDNNGNVFTTGYFDQSITFGNITLTDLGGSDIFVVKYNAQGDVIWANSYGGTSFDYASRITSDAQGNIILTGGFRSESIGFGNTTLANPNGPEAFFVTKINPQGDVLWAKTAANDSNCWGNDLTADTEGNVIVTGSFSGTSAAFGTVTLNNTSQTFTDFFIVKYNALGDVIWAQSFGGNNNDSGSGLVSDSNDNIFMIGAYQSSEITFGVTTFHNSGGIDYFMLQFDSSGNLIWMRKAMGDGNEIGRGIDIDQNGNLYVTGTFSGTYATFELTTLTGNGYDNMFIIKYNSLGHLQWIHSPLGNDNDEPYALTVDHDGSVLVTGEYYSNPLTLGTFELSNTSTDYSNLFVTKINPEGLFAWALSTGGSDDDYGLNITTLSNGNAYLTGGFRSSSLDFGNTTLVNTSDSPDYFIAKLNSITGISDEEFYNYSAIFPNPAKDFIQIKTTTNVDIEICNMAGQSLLISEVSATNARLTYHRFCLDVI